MKFSVFGPRKYPDRSIVVVEVWRVLAEEVDLPRSQLSYLHGGAKGPQEFFLDEAESFGIDTIIFQPWTVLWKELNRLTSLKGGRHNPIFYFLRNMQICENSDLVIILDDGSQDPEVTKVRAFCERKGINFEEINL